MDLFEAGAGGVFTGESTLPPGTELNVVFGPFDDTAYGLVIGAASRPPVHFGDSTPTNTDTWSLSAGRYWVQLLSEDPIGPGGELRFSLELDMETYVQRYGTFPVNGVSPARIPAPTYGASQVTNVAGSGLDSQTNPEANLPIIVTGSVPPGPYWLRMLVSGAGVGTVEDKVRIEVGQGYTVSVTTPDADACLNVLSSINAVSRSELDAQILLKLRYLLNTVWHGVNVVPAAGVFSGPTPYGLADDDNVTEVALDMLRTPADPPSPGSLLPCGSGLNYELLGDLLFPADTSRDVGGRATHDDFNRHPGEDVYSAPGGEVGQRIGVFLDSMALSDTTIEAFTSISSADLAISYTVIHELAHALGLVPPASIVFGTPFDGMGLQGNGEGHDGDTYSCLSIMSPGCKRSRPICS